MTSSMASFSDKHLAVCGLARNCAAKLSSNIQFIEALTTYFASVTVVVVENDSTDQTRIILNNWAARSSAKIIDGDPGTLVAPANTKANPYYSIKRVARLAALRNQYLNYVRSLPTLPHYLLVMDFDVDRISLEGVLNSFARAAEWDVATAYGYSLSPVLKERYHDTFALVPLGAEKTPQRAGLLKAIQRAWRQNKRSNQLVPVYAAFGGLAIYKYQQIIQLQYGVCPNGDEAVEARCEHFYLADQLQKNGYQRIVINPRMHLRFQTLGDALQKKVADWLRPSRGV